MTNQDANTIILSDFDKLIAQKMALDIRYFCAEETSGNPKTKQSNLRRVTELPDSLANMITETAIGSVVLFSENFESTEQIVRLTNDLQQAALKSSLAKPLIISVDQEGGRVVRFNKATAFAGNMAIGATYQDNQTKFAEQVNSVIGKELKVLGINNNYAPVVDVNTNSENPVINTRSYGEDANQVAKLGLSAVNALQSQGVMATLKHFPGHGDTYVDSHLGLPRVDHDMPSIEKIDLVPFSMAISQSNPAMVMTAHIQYPALDKTTFITKMGEEIIRPATMSRKILTDLLRNKMSFKGIIATDALDMAGVAHYFEPVQATVETFIAGADLAVMPFKMRNNRDIEQFKLFIKAVSNEVANRIEHGEITAKELEQSLARIDKFKDEYIKLSNETLETQVAKAKTVVAQKEHLVLEQQLANSAVVLAKNTQQLIPLLESKLQKKTGIKRLFLVVENEIELRAIKKAIIDTWPQESYTFPQITALVASDKELMSQIQDHVQLKQADLVIAAINMKTASLVDLGGVDDLLITRQVNINDKFTYSNLVELQLQAAKKNKVKSILIARGSPYLMDSLIEITNVILLTFDDRSYALENTSANSPGYNASLAIILGQQDAQGVLPVTL